MHIETIKIKSSHPSQGDFVVINKSDFDPAVHELWVSEDERAAAAWKAQADADAAEAQRKAEEAAKKAEQETQEAVVAQADAEKAAADAKTAAAKAPRPATAKGSK